ncbi:hypothetical protein HK405_008225, partial [Cladochytrium tenue]
FDAGALGYTFVDAADAVVPSLTISGLAAMSSPLPSSMTSTTARKPRRRRGRLSQNTPSSVCYATLHGFTTLRTPWLQSGQMPGTPCSDIHYDVASPLPLLVLAVPLTASRRLTGPITLFSKFLHERAIRAVDDGVAKVMLDCQREFWPESDPAVADDRR